MFFIWYIWQLVIYIPQLRNNQSIPWIFEKSAHADTLLLRINNARIHTYEQQCVHRCMNSWNFFYLWQIYFDKITSLNLHFIRKVCWDFNHLKDFLLPLYQKSKYYRCIIIVLTKLLNKIANKNILRVGKDILIFFHLF